ncbi:MAG TPA: hypothetical protein VFM06_01150 [Candidatus Limnocylindria bacterium]|nr:hypothetical protein [Candidatus Limnocylindria bacterium]
MVDALHDAAAVLRIGGAVVEVRPAVSYAPTLWIRRGARRIRLGRMDRHADPEIRQAEEATHAVLRDRSFALVIRRRRTWMSRYAGVEDLEHMLRANPGWSMPRATRARLASVWRSGDTLELGRVLSLAVLRRREPVRVRARSAIR